MIVDYMEKQKRDVRKLTDVLDANGITYTVTNIQEDPAAQLHQSNAADCETTTITDSRPS